MREIIYVYPGHYKRHLDIFQIINHNCLILENAVTRYKAILNNLYEISQREIKNRESWSQEKDIKFMFRRYRVEKVAREENRERYQGNIQGLNIKLTRPCDEYPKLGMNENCMFILLHIYLQTFVQTVYKAIFFVRYSFSLQNCYTS